LKQTERFACESLESKGKRGREKEISFPPGKKRKRGSSKKDGEEFQEFPTKTTNLEKKSVPNYGGGRGRNIGITSSFGGGQRGELRGKKKKCFLV